MKWVSDSIGEQYKEWKDGDKIFIESPTGSGKTQFILNVILPYFSKQRQRILYLVNRRILKKQMETEISKLPFDLKRNIDVKSYQSIENQFCKIVYNQQRRIHMALGKEGVLYLQNYGCVICDECHYFLADANYNTNTVVSFRVVDWFFKRKIRIFMSATIDNVKGYILEWDNEKNRRKLKTQIYGFLTQSLDYSSLQVSKQIFSYNTDIDYSYIDIQVINNKKSDIVDLVKEKSGKWLIFVDNVAFGKELKQGLIALFKNVTGREELEKDVIFITSQYEEDEESLNEVDTVIEKNIFQAKVIICTAVMDNGINIKDSELRNIIVIADNQVEFIQMLGRKRRDGQQLKLYIVRQPRDYFTRRQCQVQKLLGIAEDYFKKIQEKVDYMRYISYSNENGSADQICKNEKIFTYEQHMIIMQKIANGEIRYEEAAKLFCVFGGIIYLNILSFRNLEYQNLYYQKVIERYDTEGKDAFVREQLEWLGKTQEEIDVIIRDSSMSTVEKYRKFVIEKLEEKLDIPMGREQMLNFKAEIADKLRYLVEQVEDSNLERKTVIDSISKNERPLSKKNMEFLNKYCNLPFQIEVKDGQYTIKRHENEN